MATINALEFYFNITPVIIWEQRPQDDYDPLQHWYPPVRSNHFERDDANSTGWNHWTRRGITYLNQFYDPENTKSCSIFFDYGREYFLVAQCDCLTRMFDRMSRFTEPWSRIMFDYYQDGNHQPLSLITTYPASGESMLHAQGGPTWMPELVPRTYDGLDRTQYANVAGDLLILLGLAAFTCEPEPRALLRTLEHNFRPPRWIPRNIPPPAPCKRADISRRRGYVVKVAPCPGVDLEAFEQGFYGPLLVGDERSLQQ